jgi:hypothetical protein
MNTEVKEYVTDLTTDISELVVDSFLNDGLLKDIPIVGFGVKVIKLGTSISDMILLNKLKIFMENINIVSENDIDKFKEKMTNDKYKKEIGIKLLNIIDKIDEYAKIKWIAVVFLDYLDKNIDKEFFFRIITIINDTFLQDILNLKVFKGKEDILSNNKVIEAYVLHQLFSHGLLDNAGIDGGGAIEEIDSGTIYALNKFGDYILKKLL